jgi:putative endonuclease
MNILKVLTKNKVIGNFGENAAVRYLKHHKYKILERNYIANGSEIDIIAKSKDMLIFVEVKTRTFGKESPFELRPAASVDYEKQRKIISAAKWYLSANEHNGKISGLLKRLDVIEVYVKKENDKQKTDRICHIEGAFWNDYEIYKHTRYKKRGRQQRRCN